MSGPVEVTDTSGHPASATATAAGVEVVPGRTTTVGGAAVRRVLPRRAHRTIGAWCFFDHFGPTGSGAGGLQIGPHPHIGLQTVTWLLSGRVLHRDSLGSEQLIRPGQLNVMTAGAGIAHAEETPPGEETTVHGVQLWIAQPEATRHGAPAFEHHAELPVVGLAAGRATVLSGDLGGARSPARQDTDLVGAQLDLGRGRSSVVLRTAFEHGVVPLTGPATLDGQSVEPGTMGYLGPGRTEVAIGADAPVVLMLVGGTPLPEPVLMGWNFVARTRQEIDQAHADWAAHHRRFGPVHSALPRVTAPS